MQRWQQIEELYHSAREHGVGVLADVDPEMRGEVERLLGQDSESGNKLLDQSAAKLMSTRVSARVAAGSQLGPYKIETLLGQGGMGQVFRATDTRLNRKVAIKVCNEEFSGRIEQESRSIAAINHPNVCTLHDVGPNYLVMELLEGETLSARLKRGRFSVAETIRFGCQIADALAVAHGKGIVHRDLKPGNIMFTKSGIKVLDFGLAKSAVDPALTAAGGVMGTPAYMAPERLEGREADARSDVYSLGLVLSEMLTGKRSKHPDGLPPALDRVVKRCIEIDPDDRWQCARDLKWELEACGHPAEPASARSWNPWLGGTLGVAAVALAALAFVHFREQRASEPLARLNVMLPEKSRVRSLAISPDGRHIAMVLLRDGKQQIWVRDLDAQESIALEGTDNAADPFWSPNSRFIGFIADAKLKKIDRMGGPVQTLCDALGTLGGTWNQNGDILIGALGNVQRVSDSGGAVSNLAAALTYPAFLPDGHHYIGRSDELGDPAKSGLWLGSLDGSALRRILPDTSSVEVAGPPPGSRVGAILFVRSGELMALPFDMERLEARGEPYAVARGIAAGISYRSLAAASSSGVLAYVPGPQADWQYVWRDRQGKHLGAIGNAGAVVMISPDGKRLVGSPGGNITVLDFANGITTRVAFQPHGGMNPIWSPDGKYVAYNNTTGMVRKRADGAGVEEQLVQSNTMAVPKSWSPDGKYIVYAQINPGTGADLLAVPVEGDRRPLVLAQTTGNEDQGQFSPDGHWVAYTSNESGQSEIYVIPFPPTANGGRWQVSRGGGVQPRWRRNGKELFYISPDWKMMAVPVNTRPTFSSGTPQALFDTEEVDTGIRTGPLSWDISPDGNRFLIISENATDTKSVSVVLNWEPVGQ